MGVRYSQIGCCEYLTLRERSACRKQDSNREHRKKFHDNALPLVSNLSSAIRKVTLQSSQAKSEFVREPGAITNRTTVGPACQLNVNPGGFLNHCF